MVILLQRQMQSWQWSHWHYDFKDWRHEMIFTVYLSHDRRPDTSLVDEQILPQSRTSALTLRSSCHSSHHVRPDPKTDNDHVKIMRKRCVLNVILSMSLHDLLWYWCCWMMLRGQFGHRDLWPPDWSCVQTWHCCFNTCWRHLECYWWKTRCQNDTLHEGSSLEWMSDKHYLMIRWRSSQSCSQEVTFFFDVSGT